jgi:hypothetical protein
MVLIIFLIATLPIILRYSLNEMMGVQEFRISEFQNSWTPIIQIPGLKFLEYESYLAAVLTLSICFSVCEIHS